MPRPVFRQRSPYQGLDLHCLDLFRAFLFRAFLFLAFPVLMFLVLNFLSPPILPRSGRRTLLISQRPSGSCSVRL